MSKKSSARLSIFDTFKTKSKEITGEASRQRSIIVNLSKKSNPAERTRTALSQKIAEEHGIQWKNIYSGIFRDLDEVLIPLGFVKEEGRLPLKRGPRALQEKGIPYYQLTPNGLLVALSLDELPNRESILREFFQNTSSDEKSHQEVILQLAKVAPKFTYSLFHKYVQAFCDGSLKNLTPFSFDKLKAISDESVATQKELLEGFLMLSKSDKEKAIDFLHKLS